MKATIPTKKSKYSAETIQKEFRSFIIDKKHPCIMANTVFALDDFHLHLYKRLGSKSSANKLLNDLRDYIEDYDFSDNKFKAFIAVFPEMDLESEKEFENLLWKQLQLIHDEDPVDWDHRVSNNPEDNEFSFSIGGRAFYVIGMHPKSSRMARRSPYPTLVFNLHWQFEKLREMGVYQKVRDKIRKRDAALQGTINPVLEDFGDRSEARQYSGRNVKSDWKCPFHPKE